MLDNLYILTKNADNSYSPILVNYTMSKYLPMQISFGDEGWADTSRTASKGMMAGMLASGLMKVFM